MLNIRVQSFPQSRALYAPRPFHLHCLQTLTECHVKTCNKNQRGIVSACGYQEFVNTNMIKHIYIYYGRTVMSTRWGGPQPVFGLALDVSCALSGTLIDGSPTCYQC